MKRLVTVTKIYEHTYLVDAESDEEAEELVDKTEDGCPSSVNFSVSTKSNGCDVFEDYCETQYSVRLPEGENLSLYDTCE